MRCKYCRAQIAGDEICYRAQSGKYDRAYNVQATEEVESGVVCMSCQRNRDEYEGRLNAITPRPANSEAEGYEPPPPEGNVHTARRSRNV